MQRCEQEGLDYLFEQRLTKGTKRLIERLLRDAQWTDAGQGWQGAEAQLRLSGWSRSRRVVVLRRRLNKDLAVEAPDDSGQLRLSFTEVEDDVRLYEYAVLATSLDAEILSVAALYRDRADCEIYQSYCLYKAIKWVCRGHRRCARRLAAWSNGDGVPGDARAGARVRPRRPRSATAVARHAEPGARSASLCAAS